LWCSFQGAQTVVLDLERACRELRPGAWLTKNNQCSPPMTLQQVYA
jgi:hypothetical protein